MRYLFMPTGAETLQVRGRYDFVDHNGTHRATELWERYRNAGSPVETWRSEWQGEAGGQRFNVRAHTVLSPDGVERLKLRRTFGDRPAEDVTITTGPDSVLLSRQDGTEEVDLPAGYGLFAPQPSLARFALPFRLASEHKALGMVLYFRLLADTIRVRPVKFSYTPLGYRAFTVRAQRLRAKGWRLEVPGMPPQEAWFDRNGTCLHWTDDHPRDPWEATLAAWQTFG